MAARRARWLFLALAALTACAAEQEPQLPAVGVEVLARVGSAARPARVVPERVAVARKLGTLTRNAFPAREPFELELPETAERLAFSIACPAQADAATCAPFRIEATDGGGGGRWRRLFEESARAKWLDREIALAAAPQRRLRLSLAHDADGEALWGSVRVMGPAAQPRPNVVLISMDTLGAASLEAPSAPPDLSPRLDAIRAQGADFRRAYAQYGNTLVSHASLFSALYPRSHGVYSGGVPAPLRSSLVSVLAGAGYHTVAFTEGAFVSAAFGFSEGFDHYDDGMLFLGKQIEGGAAETFQRAARWIAEHAGSQRFFAFVHSYEVHLPYLPRDDEARRIAAQASRGDERIFSHEEQSIGSLAHNRGTRPFPPGDLARLEALHLGEVHTLDAIIGAFVDHLSASGLADQTLLVITADHGDQFGEWGKVGHGDSLHDRVIRVPLIFHWSGAIAPRRIESPVQLIDVMPTILALTGVAASRELDGTSLVPQLEGQATAPLPAFSELRTARGECARLGREAECQLDQLSVHDGRWKLVSSRTPTWRRLFDLRSDPREEHDVASLHPEEADRLAKLADRYREQGMRDVEGGSGAVDPDTLQRLRDLGYVDSAAEPRRKDSPDQPSDMLRAP